MTTGNPTKNSKAHSNWYVAPLVWLAIATLSLVVAPNWDDLIAPPAEGFRIVPATQVPTSAGELSAPAASSIFTKPHYAVEVHVEAF